MPPRKSHYLEAMDEQHWQSPIPQFRSDVEPEIMDVTETLSLLLAFVAWLALIWACLVANS